MISQHHPRFPGSVLTCGGRSITHHQVLNVAGSLPFLVTNQPNTHNTTTTCGYGTTQLCEETNNILGYSAYHGIHSNSTAYYSQESPFIKFDERYQIHRRHWWSGKWAVSYGIKPWESAKNWRVGYQFSSMSIRTDFPFDERISPPWTRSHSQCNCKLLDSCRFLSLYWQLSSNWWGHAIVRQVRNHCNITVG